MNPPLARPALLLLGPTGSGKSPLGDRLEQCGLPGRPCVHFDFGRLLRKAAEVASFSRRQRLTPSERETILRVLREGALLESASFGIALKLFDGFVRQRCTPGNPLLILNGLPRQTEQARQLDRRIRVETVVRLECDADTVAERIRRNSGGDRGGRTDDTPDSIRHRLRLFYEYTAPLVHHYSARGARSLFLPVGPGTTAGEAHQVLAARVLDSRLS